MNYVNYIFITIGIYTIVVGITGFGLQTRKGQRVVRILGETGAKIFYILIGIGLVVAGFLVNFQ